MLERNKMISIWVIGLQNSRSIMKIGMRIEHKLKSDAEISVVGGTPIQLRKGLSLQKLRLLSVIGATGMVLDLAFHWLNVGTPLAFIDDGLETNAPLLLQILSFSGHTMFIVAFTLLIAIPRLFFTQWRGIPQSVDDNWAMLRAGCSVRQLWYISLLAIIGIALDIAFHWMESGNPMDPLLDGQDDPRLFVRALAASAHIMFFGAFMILLFLPKILFSPLRKGAAIR